MEYWSTGVMEYWGDEQKKKTEDRMKNKKIEPITKAPFDYAQDRNLESTKKDLVFYITPSYFVLSYLHVFVVSS